MNKVERYRMNKQYESLKYLGPKDWKRYTPEEEVLVMNTTIRIVDIAKILGRSYRAIREKRKKIRTNKV
jgi:hypothetical protein